MKKIIENLIVDFAETYMKQNQLQNIWRQPLVGFADAFDPYIRRLSSIVTEEHRMPEEFLSSANVVIAYFLPFTEMVANTNIKVPDNSASKMWSQGYKYTEEIVSQINLFLVQQIEKMGYKAVIPSDIGMREDILKSNWSHRHIAYAAGLGTFGINNMLITKQGCCGRYHSIIADIPVEPDSHVKGEYCLYKSKGICKKCVENCFSGALTINGFNRYKCWAECKKNLDVYGVDVCGKCTTGIPCAFRAPGR